MPKFDESRHDTGGRAPEQGGEISPEQLAENAEPLDACEVAPEDEQPVHKVTSTPSGAKRGGSFKARDYQ